MGPGTRKLGAAIVGLAALLTALSALSDRGLSRLSRMGAEVRRLEQLNTGLAEENSRLVLRIHALQEDPRTLEAVAREDLGLVRPGEVVFRFEPAP